MAKKRVVHVSTAFPPSLGGMEKVVQSLARAQAALGIHVTVVTSRRGCQRNNIAEPFEVMRLKSFCLLSTTIIPNLLFKLLKEGRDTIVHVHVTQAYTPEMVWLASKMRRFKYIAHMHIDAPPSTWAGMLLVPYKKIFLKRVLASASQVIVFTEDQKNAICDKYGLRSDKVAIVPNGVENHFYVGKAHPMHKKPRLLFVGRLGFQKNLPMLLRALEGVSHKFETTLVGDGELGTELRDLTKELKLSNVAFVGRKDGDDLLGEYRKADIFVLTSEREGMPLVLLEAMAMGLPVVATDVTGSRDVVEPNRTGLLVKLEDIDAFRQALLDLRADPALYSRLAECSVKTSRRYSWQRINDAVVRLYGGLV